METKLKWVWSHYVKGLELRDGERVLGTARKYGSDFFWTPYPRSTFTECVSLAEAKAAVKTELIRRNEAERIALEAL